jgi:hypothetical protein
MFAWVALGIVVATMLLYVHDKRQTSDPVLRRFPVLADIPIERMIGFNLASDNGALFAVGRMSAEVC